MAGKNIDTEIPVYLGGCNENNLYGCYRLVGGNKDEIRLLYCEHEEADDRLQYHISHAVKVEKFENILVCSGDTDVYTSLLYNYEFNWRKAGLQQNGNNTMKRFPLFIAQGCRVSSSASFQQRMRLRVLIQQVRSVQRRKPSRLLKMKYFKIVWQRLVKTSYLAI